VVARFEGPKSAAEFLDELHERPDYVEKQTEIKRRQAENRCRYARAAAGLLADLRNQGLTVESMSQLRALGKEAAWTTPTLLKWLPSIEYLPLKRDVIAVLGMKWARSAAPGLIEEFRRLDPDRDPPGGARWAIADSLERTADDRLVEDIVALATDEKQGDQRGLIVAALGNMKKNRNRVVPLLIELLRDPKVMGYAVMGLGKISAVETRPLIEPLLKHPDHWIREEARKTLRKFDRTQDRISKQS
jgi:hypothetical protein